MGVGALRLPGPSVELVLAVYLIVVAFMLGLGWPWPDDPDIWWHLKTGEWMVMNGTVMRTDPFGLNTSGARCIVPSWLAEVLFYRTNQTFPALGLRVIQGLVVASTTAILLSHAWLASRSFRVAFLLSALFLVPIFPWVARPQIFSFMFMAVAMLVLWWGQNRNPRVLWFLIPLMLLWANLHAYFIVGLGFILLVLGLPWLRWLLKKRLSDEKPSALSLVIMGFAILAPLINPYGYQLYGETLFMAVHASGSWAADWIQELQSPGFHDWPMKVFFGWIAVAVLVFVFSGKRPTGLAIFLFLGLLYQSLLHRRDVPYFLIVMLPIMAERIVLLPGLGWQRFFKVGKAPNLMQRVGLIRFGLHWVLLFMAVGALVWAPQRLAPSLPEPKTNFSDAARWVLAHRPPAPIYHSLNKGGYLIYALWPDYKVFIDGRTGLYSDHEWQEHNDVRLGRPDWHDKLLASGACTVIWEKKEPLVSLLLLKPEWTLVYEDEDAAVFVRKACL